MDKHDDDSGVSRVSGNATDCVGSETLIEKLGCEGDELMVEVVGSDVFFDGVSGVGMGGNGELGVREDGVEIAGSSSDKIVVDEYVVEKEGGVEVDVNVAVSEGDGLGNIAGSLDDKVVVMEEVGILAKESVVEEDVKVAVSEGGLEKGEEVTYRDGLSCELATPSAREDSDMHRDGRNGDTKVGEEDVKAVVDDDCKKCEKLIERDGVSRDVAALSAHEDSNMDGDAVNCDTKVVEEDVKVFVDEDSEKREIVAERDGVSCEMAVFSAHENSDMHGDALKCGSEVVKEDVKVAENEDALGRGENVTERDDVSCELVAESAQEDCGMPGEAVNGAGETLVVTESSSVNTHVAENLDSVVNEDGAEAVKFSGEVLEKQMTLEIGGFGNEASDAHVLDATGSADKSVDAAQRTELIEDVIEEDVKVVVSEGGERGEEVTVRDDVSCVLATPSACEDSDMHGDAMNFDTEVAKEDSEVVAYKDYKKCEAVTERNDGGCKLTVTSAFEDTDMQVDNVNSDSKFVEEDPKIALIMNATGRGENVIERDDVRCGLAATSSVHELSGIHGVAINGADEVSAGDKSVGIKSYNKDTSDVPENLATVNNEGIAEEAVKPLGEVLENQIMQETDKLQEADVLDKAMDIEHTDDYDEKISEQMSPGDGRLFSDCHSSYLLPPKNEGEFAASDLVWGKVRSHPWWPGQICDPSDASEKAMKYHKKDCFLVSYFGDRTFAWNDASWLRPFRTHFSQIKEQSNSEAFHHAVSCALAEVSRRVELGLACSCIPKSSFAEIESQILENAGIRQEAGIRYGVDESSAASCFEPGELLEHIRSLAVFPSADSDVLLQLVISKAQLSALSRFKGQGPLPKFQLCGGLLEKDANTDGIQQHGEQIKGENNFSSKRSHDFADNLPPRKRERSLSDLMEDKPHSSDGDDEFDSNMKDKSFASSAGIKRKALDSFTEGSDKRQSYYAAKVSTTASQTPKPSFKIGECIRRVASQLTASPLLVKSNSEKFLKIDDSVEQHVGFEDALQTPVNSQKEAMMVSPEHSSLAEILSQLHLAAQDPKKGYSFLKNITSFFTGFRHSVALGQSSRTRNSSTGRGGRKRKTPQSNMNSPEDFEFDDVNDSYWTDRIVQNYGEDELLNNAQNGEAEYHLVLHQADKPVKSGRRSRKQFSNGEHLIVAEEPIAEPIDKKPDCSPTELILNFSPGHSLPTELNLNKIFRRFGPLRECETEVDRESRRARVVYKRCSDAEVALSSAGNFSIFGPMHVDYELSYVPSAPYKPLPVAALEGELNANPFI
ncbi:uncharacterized protein LOC141698124 [Apium graveolens]|uniref:uncharacterized protein LOC141698124 n=1 Tax=Apium graveolens TaxID=4045 RepID=UPI003D78F3B4